MTKLSWGKRFRVMGVPHYPAKPENPKAKQDNLWSDRELKEARKSYRFWNKKYLELVAQGKTGKKERSMAQSRLEKIKELGANAKRPKRRKVAR